MKPSPSGGDEHRRLLTREVEVINKQGIHARPAAMFVKTAAKYESEVGIEKEGEIVNGKSIIGLLMLAAGQGTKLTLTAEGRDAEKALAELSKLFENKFNED
ncbi:MAG: HPr family phosphocarrier protein [Verrucomicrobiia bacterium]|jgi:phosphocarrier protein